MHKRPHDSVLTEALLRKYRDGTLTPEEARQVAQLQHDPFYADALEGVQHLPDGAALARGTARLRTQLATRTARRPAYRRYVGRIAAAILLLLASSYLLYRYADRTSVAPLAEESTPLMATDSTNLTSIEVLPSLPARLPNALALARPTPPPFLLSPVPRPATLSLSEEDLVENDVSLNLSEAVALDEEIEQESLVFEEAPQAPIPKAPIRRRSLPALASAYTISGQVVDADTQEPIPGVNVLVKNTTVGVITDIEGQFSIQAPANRPLVFSSIGYATSEIDSLSQNMQVALSPDLTALSEVVVVGYGSQKRTAATYTPPTPVGGMRSFKQYLREALRHPPEVAAEQIKGTVKVDFIVGADGTLSDFRIKKSLCAACDQEAIRLIREGPPWQPSQREDVPVEKKMRVKVKFK